MKITFVANSLRNYGGLEKWHIFIGNQLSKEYEVEVLGIDMGEQKRIGMEDLKKLIAFDYAEIDEFKAPYISDVFYITIGNRSVINNIFKYCRGRKVFGAHHSEYVYYSKQKRIRDGIDWEKHILSPKALAYKLWISRLLKVLPRFYAVHILNDSLLYYLRYNKNTFLLPNATDVHPAGLKKYGDFTVLFYGRHELMKGTRTVEYIGKHFPDLRLKLDIVGSGPESKDLMNLGYTNVRFRGQVPEWQLKEMIERSHLVLFPSYMENSPLIPIESLAMGTPIIARSASFNGWLRGANLCSLASTDKEFLDQIETHYKMWASSPESYEEKCRTLSKIPMSEMEYKEKFINMLTKVVA